MNRDNRRATFRCPVADMPSVTLHLRDGNSTSRYEGNVFDESAGGFGLFLPQKPGFESGERVILSRSETEYLCLVSYVKAEQKGIHRIGLQILDEIEEDPEKHNVAGTGGTTKHSRGSGFMGPLFIALAVFVIAAGGFLYFESTKVYRDEFGRPYKGSVQTALRSLYESVFGTAEDKPKSR